MPSVSAQKVCLVAISLGKGGAERSTALLSEMLDSLGYEVHIVILNDLVQYPFKGKLFNLGTIKSQQDSMWKRILRFRKLRRFLKQEKFDWIIDNRTRSVALKEWYYLRFIYQGFNLIYVIRSAFLDEYLPKDKGVSNMIVNNVKKIVGVSDYITEKINTEFNTHKAVTIYNPVVRIQRQENREEFEKYILFVGRLDEKVKNISLLLKGFARSVLPASNIKLKIVGEGADKKFLKQEVTRLHLEENVDFEGFISDIYPVYEKALCTVLTSRYEGFPRVLIESLSAGTPVVSVDCVSGPAEIVRNEENGLLIENHSSEEVTKALNRMVLDKSLYQNCKNNSKNSIAHLSFEKIAGEWDKVLKNEKNRS